MSDDGENAIPPNLQPAQADVDYDLDAALGAVVSLRAEIPEDAFTASVLGTERTGHGIVVTDGGLIVTIGYLVTEAETIWVVTRGGQAVAGHLVGYDYETGFGLVQALGRLDCPVMPLGDSGSIDVGTECVVAGFGGPTEALKVHVAARHEFAGYWEYVLDDAIFTAPPHPNWGGAALIGADGRLAGVGSLYIDQIVPELPSIDGNLSVPIDLLKPIMEELTLYGRTLKPARPWLGMFVSQVEDRFMVAGVYKDAPAAAAGLRAGDIVLDIDGGRASDLAGLFRHMWSLGDAGCEVPLRVERDGETLDIAVRSVDRRDFWKTPELH
ncbi:MAG: S1C family serine protease [Gammaproteobacteria bacterium]